MHRSLAVAVVMLVLAFVAIIVGVLAGAHEEVRSRAPWVAAFALVFAVAYSLLSVTAYKLREDSVRRDRLTQVEGRFREHPEKPQLAWDLARTKLENYLDRNLSQVNSIYWLTALVMFGGFALVMYGLWKAFERPDTLAVAIVASASGVLISFIGGSFLLVHRSIIAQSKEYVTVLERINAVGMAVQVIDSISNEDLKHLATTELAGQLLGMYTGAARPAAAYKSAKS